MVVMVHLNGMIILTLTRRSWRSCNRTQRCQGEKKLEYALTISEKDRL